jgi:tetratricopeptide (TPR) repeat protein
MAVVLLSRPARCRTAVVMLLALALGACATAAPVPDAPAARPPAAPAAPAAPAPPPGPTKRQVLAAQHRERAQALEREGALRRALDEWEIALAIEPGDAAARDGRASLEARIEGAVAARIAEGRAALARGSLAEARRRLLSALALDPANRAAFEVLQNEAREMPFLTHTVRAGETLGSLAQQYYGDRMRSEVIWETNRLPPNTRLAAGTSLKIPEIPGVPFVRPEPAPRPAPGPPGGAPGGGTARPAPPAPAAPAAPPPRDEPPEVDPLLADAREALERSDYAVALADVDKFLASSPSNREGIDLKKVALYRHGKKQLDQRQWDDSYRTLTQLARLQPDYQDASRLLQQARTRSIERHYSEGLRLYQAEKLPEAIAEWRVVLEVDPQHANARRNIDQAERLLKGLEQRRKR